jgi:hypothetical protein
MQLYDSKEGKMQERDIQIFPDKKEVTFSFRDALEHIQQKQEYAEKKDISQEVGTWNFVGEYPNLPHAFTFVTDAHFGSVFTDYRLLAKHYEIAEQTPNMAIVQGGDSLDAFSPVKHPTGIASDAIPPDEQAEAIIQRLLELNQQNKLGAVQMGNHDQWTDLAGFRFHQFLKDLTCPIYSGAGILKVNVGANLEPYEIYWSHTHWGNSKLNITNAAKRAIQFTAPNADLALLGHTHQSAYEMFDLAGKTRGAIVGGTYKTHDPMGRRWGLDQSGMPGITVILWPDQHMFEIVKTPEVAQALILGQIALSELNLEI